MVVVDRLRKFAHFMLLTHPYTTKVVAKKFIEGIIKLHRILKSIISDRDSIFINHFWHEFFKRSETQLKKSSTHHPQIDRQTEVVNRCLEQYLCSFFYQNPWKWHFYLPWIEYWYKTTYHASTWMTLFQALYGWPPPVLPHYVEGNCPVNEVDCNLFS